jgi:hypothetical protein
MSEGPPSSAIEATMVSIELLEALDKFRQRLVLVA